MSLGYDACRVFREFSGDLPLSYFKSISSRRFRINHNLRFARRLINREEPKTDRVPFTDKNTMKINLFSVAFSLSVVSSVSARRKKTEDDPSLSLEKEFSRVLDGGRREQKQAARHLSGGRGVSLTLSVNLKSFVVC
jgi:hypothetical protein